MTSRPHAGAAPSRREIALALRDVRERTLQLVAPLSDDALTRQHDTLMSPIVWDLGHIGAFEELWLVRRPGEVASESELEEIYDAFRTPRSARGGLDLPARAAVLDRLASVRAEALKRLADADLDSANPLLRGGFAWEMVRQHEAQHQETILQTILLMTSEAYEPVRRWGTDGGAADCLEAPGAGAGEMIRVPSGPFQMGAPPTGFAYDNERPRHRMHLDAFEIGRHPVTNAEYVEFIAAGGYEDASLWTDEGWAWAREAGLSAPKYWVPEGESATPGATAARELSRDRGLAGWTRRTSLGREPLDAGAPVAHVCFHEAEAYARFAVARLPTEAEWEKAAAWDPDAVAPRTFPWGEERPSAKHANLDQLRFGTVPVGSFPLGRSAVGCQGMLGDLWEWTSTAFDGYPGFEAFPYREYSAVFFGPDYRVLRGGSWATRPAVARNTFRNWDYPIRRQIFAGLRLARDA
ncbi:MAG: ergothioneine biosynthesis protein EgtB [Gemmatimonadales bacterium]|jgi:iron(II)-dependent oxidoreductase